MAKQLVTAALTGRIYDATIKKDGTMSEKGRVDRTEECVLAVASHLHLEAELNQEQKGFWQMKFPGFGTLTWVSETEEEKAEEPEQDL